MSGTMRAATVVDHNTVEVRDFPMPEVKKFGDLVVKMHRASICGSDVHVAWHGFLNPEAQGKPGYPGHEGVGEVVQTLSPEYKVGDMVLTVPVGNVGGCFAEYQLITDKQVVPVPAGADLDRILMAQQYGTTLFSMRMIWPQIGNTGKKNNVAAVIGAGSAGLFFMQQALLLGFENIVISDLNADRLAVAKNIGASHVVHAPQESFVDKVMEVTNGEGADLVIEAAGYDSLRADAVHAVRKFGTVGYFGFPEKPGDVPFPSAIAFRKIARIQWVGGTQSEPGLVAFRDAVRHIHEGLINVGYCTESHFDLEDAPKAFEIARDQGQGKVKLILDLVK